MIDFHTHILPNQVEKMVRDYGNDGVFIDMFKENQETSDNSKLIKSMSNSNIEASVLMGYGWTNFDVLKMSNSYNLKSAQNNDKLIPFSSVNPKFGIKNNNELKNCILKGAKGIGEIHPSVQQLDMSDFKAWKGIMDIALDANIPIAIHCSEPIGHLYPGKGNVSLKQIYEFIKLFPHNKIVLSHWGGGLIFYELMKEVKKYFKNVYYDTAATSYLYKKDIFEISLKIVGPEKILFGSDFPILKPSRILAEIKDIKISDLKKITSVNAKSLLEIN